MTATCFLSLENRTNTGLPSLDQGYGAGTRNDRSLGKVVEPIERFYFDSPINEISDADEVKIERTRHMLKQAVQSGKKFTDYDVVQLSQKLDEYLLEIQKKRLIRREIRNISESLE
ncbi:aspartyl-phosphate phosphatase Spo0E family protein [Paenibacillus thiaminolyticus]|uniref:Aspartyl-phosphate phosphatase Spo0E family protein n=1 Tax=Paenibacillus thiaminolyticus TaxID=49283 RepID=A0A3A3GLR3_PANTH|nr:aspartyl-phosphate phosphatase Spo0E family protein [Paenibacillus thiaminolyticus]RJG23703.1 aspartyl-phosphate phosphatase Spo0E family protein [Paenibacillus thiaminolyticus]